MDHREFVSHLPHSAKVHLTTKSDRIGLKALCFHWGAILGTGALIALGVPGWPVLIVAQGILIAFLFTLLHETSHRTAFESAWINDWVARACGILILTPAVWFRYFHFAHHRHTQDPVNDPELRHGKPATLPGYLLHISGLPVWTGNAATLFRNALGLSRDPFVPDGARSKIRTEALFTILFYLGLAAGSFALQSAALLYVWIIPVVLGQPFLRFYLLAEHGRCPQVTNMLENSRTTYTNSIIRAIAWNMPYHAEHHSYPAVPFHKLPELNALMETHLKETSEGYVKFHKDFVGEMGEHQKPVAPAE